MSDFRVTLLGTGTPIPVPDRFGPSTLVEAGDQKLLFDAGRGASIRLHQLGVPIGSIDALLLTHFHSDHTVGIPDVWLTGWLEAYFGTRTAPLRVIGPEGARTLMTHLEQAYALDVSIRIEDEKLSPQGAAIDVSEFAADGVVYEKNGVRVIAFEVDHGDAIKPAYGYRIEYRGRSVVISGDTRFNRKRNQIWRRRRPPDPRGRDRAARVARRTFHPAHHGAPHDRTRSWDGVRTDAA